MKAKRVFLIVLDSVGAGEMPDAAAFGDSGANTLRSVWSTNKLNIPTLRALGIGNIDGLDFLGKTKDPKASVARMSESSLGKDTTVGHWEIAVAVSGAPLPTFPAALARIISRRLEEYRAESFFAISRIRELPLSTITEEKQRKRTL